MTQSGERPENATTGPFPGDAEQVTDLGQCPRLAGIEPEAQHQSVAFIRFQRVQDLSSRPILECASMATLELLGRSSERYSGRVSAV